MRYVFRNFVWSFLTEEVLEVATVLPVEDTSRFPALAGDEIFMCALHDGEQEPELVRMILVGSDSITVERAQEGTVARVWPQGTKVFNSVTAAMFDLVGYPATLAENVEFTPVGDVESLTVQDAIAELAGDLDIVEMGLANAEGDIAAIQAELAGLPAVYAPLVHTHPSIDITDFSEAVDDRVEALLQEGSNVTLVYDDTLGTLTIHSSGGSGVSDGDKGDITVASGGTVWTINSGAIGTSEVVGLDAALADLAADIALKSDIGHDHDSSYAPLVHTHPISDVTGLTAALDAKADDSEITTINTALAGKQPLDAMLTALAALVSANNKGLYFTGVDTPALYDLSAFALTLLDDANATAALTTLTAPGLTLANSFTAAQTITVTGQTALTLASTDATASEGPSVYLDRNSASPAASDVLGVLRWRGKNASAASKEYAGIYAMILDTTAGSEDGVLILRSTVAGGETTQLELKNGVVVGAATGAQQGTGTVNATAYYKNGVSIHAADKAYFLAHKNGTNQTDIATTLTKVTYTTEEEDNGGCYNNATSIFTAPRAGRYLIQVSLLFDPSGAGNGLFTCAIYKNGAQFRGSRVRTESASADDAITFTFVATLAANDTLEVYASDSAAAPNSGIQGSPTYNWWAVQEL